jgi:hypothetical protein
MNTTLAKFIITAAMLFTPFAATHAQVTVDEPWVRATVASQKATGAFMNLSASSSARLISAKSPAAAIVEIHEMVMEGNVMKMRAIPGIEIPAGQTLSLKPGSYHVMLIDLKQQIKAGDTVPITLVFEGLDKKQQSLEIKATARPLNSTHSAAEHKH